MPTRCSLRSLAADHDLGVEQVVAHAQRLFVLDRQIDHDAIARAVVARGVLALFLVRAHQRGRELDVAAVEQALDAQHAAELGQRAGIARAQLAVGVDRQLEAGLRLERDRLARRA